MDSLLFFLLGILFTALAAINLIAVIRRLKDHFVKTVTVPATVLNKSQQGYQTVQVRTRYIVVLDYGGKTLRFFTSLWVYDSLQNREKGSLQYCGNRFILFSPLDE